MGFKSHSRILKQYTSKLLFFSKIVICTDFRRLCRRRINCWSSRSTSGICWSRKRSCTYWAHGRTTTTTRYFDSTYNRKSDNRISYVHASSWTGTSRTHSTPTTTTATSYRPNDAFRWTDLLPTSTTSNSTGSATTSTATKTYNGNAWHWQFLLFTGNNMLFYLLNLLVFNRVLAIFVYLFCYTVCPKLLGSICVKC